MTSSNGQWGDGMAKFIRDNWLVFILLVGGTAWAVNVDGEMNRIKSERAILSEQINKINDRLIYIQGDVAYIKGLLDSAIDSE